MARKKSPNIFLLFFILIVVGVISVFLGPSGFPSNDILINFRIPRVIMAAIVGAGLSLSGTLMQATLRNPLADPYILGTSAGAALGLVLANILEIEYNNLFFYIFTVLGAFGATALAYFIARVKNRTPIVNVILAGVIVNTFIVAVILMFFVLFREKFFNVFFFMMGNISEGNHKLILISSLLILVGLVIALVNSRKLDILILGEEKALHMGINVAKTNLVSFFAVALMTSACVALAGTIGFVGFIVPHILRVILGPLHKKLIWASFFAGAIFLIVCDTIARTIIMPSEIPVGIFTVLLGAPFFLWLLKRKKQEYIF